MNDDRRDRVDALAVITADLDDLQGHRRRHFAPALVMSSLAVTVVGLTLGLRPDLWAQPWWQIVLQLGTWVMCLVLFPAIGMGLWFPGRSTRIALAIAGAVLSVVAALGWPAMDAGAMPGEPCGWVVIGTGLALLSIGALSGAFAQRRASSSLYWLAFGISLAGLDLVTWVCPNTAHDHVTATHLVPAALMALIAFAFGAWLRRRNR